MSKVRNVLAITCGSLTLGGAAAWLFVRPWWHRWGVDAADVARALPGDEVIPAAPIVDTRSITIAAPPAAVWPWLMQMGYGRGGWYSYDVVDMRGASADRVLPDQHDLAVGDTVPTHPAGGFEVKVLDPQHALVLYMDADLARTQAAAAQAAKAHGHTGEPTPVNVQMAGNVLATSQPSDFKATWAFVLEPDGEQGTRLIERTRFAFSGGDHPWTAATLPLMGFGVFIMVRKQLLGIRDRVEAARAALG